MKKVLIICDTFPPQFAPRMGYLCKFIGEYDWEAYVVSGMRQSVRADFASLVGYAKETHIIPQKKHRKWNLLHVWPMFSRYDYLRGEYDLRRRAMEVARGVKPDVILACPSGLFPLCSAYYVSKMFNIPLCVDYRDLEEQRQLAASDNRRKSLSRFFESIIGSRKTECRNVILSKADVVSSVTPWHRDILSKFNKNAYLIYNGFDPERFTPLAQAKKSSIFKITYVGTLSTVVDRDPTLLFKAVKLLAERVEIEPGKFCVEFYSGYENYRHHRNLAESLGVLPFVRFNDYVPTQKVPEILHEASILLVLGSGNIKQSNTIMTTKMFEYFAVNRPILSVPNDHGCKQDALNENKAGMSADTVDEVIDFILPLYREWKMKGYVDGKTDMKKIEKFSRRVQAKLFAEMFDAAIEYHHNR